MSYERDAEICEILGSVDSGRVAGGKAPDIGNCEGFRRGFVLGTHAG
jgi:hypothetical protein